MTAGIEGDLTASAAVGGELESGGTIEVSAGGHTVGFPPAMLLIPDVSFSNPHFTLTAKRFAQANAGIGVTVKAGIGVGGAASLTLNVGSSLDFTAQPGSCVWDAKFGQFSAEGELLDWHLSTPQTPALFTQQLGGNFCASSGPGGGGSGSGGSGGAGGAGGSGGGGAPLTDATQLSAGGNDTCSLMSGGGIDCWGANFWGLLGRSLGSGGSDVPVPIAGIAGAIQVAAGGVDPTFGEGACALRLGGKIECWGGNENGQLGDGTSGGYSPSPVAVSGITNATGVSSGGLNEVCAVLASGGIECWGNNAVGQLGVGSTEESNVPVAPSGITNARQVAVGGDFACALLASGHVDCWGWNAYGELGDGTTEQSDVPVAVSGITNAIGIAAGAGNACALLSGGTVACWGDNDTGSLGNGTFTGPQTCSGFPCSTTPVAVTGIGNATDIAVGYGSACALRTSGSIACWGRNEHGELGDGSTAASDVPVGVAGISTAGQVTVGEEYGCALLPGGRADCWGDNDSGQLGNGDTTGSDVPVAVG